MNSLRNLLRRVASAIAANPLVVKFWPPVEKFLIAGPTLIGFLLGILRYPPGHRLFEAGFQSFIFFAMYLAVMILAQALDTFFFSSWPLVLGIIRSLLATAYVLLGLKQYWEVRSRDPQIYAQVHKLRSRLTQAVGNAA